MELLDSSSDVLFWSVSWKQAFCRPFQSTHHLPGFHLHKSKIVPPKNTEISLFVQIFDHESNEFSRMYIAVSKKSKWKSNEERLVLLSNHLTGIPKNSQTSLKLTLLSLLSISTIIPMIIILPDITLSNSSCDKLGNSPLIGISYSHIHHFSILQNSPYILANCSIIHPVPSEIDFNISWVIWFRILFDSEKTIISLSSIAPNDLNHNNDDIISLRAPGIFGHASLSYNDKTFSLYILSAS